MHQSSVNIKKALFYTQNNYISQGVANSFSLDSVRNSGQKKSKTQSRVNSPKSLVQNVSNLQNLQTIKDQINHLQYSLQHSHNLQINKSKDEKSFYDQIREQLKQVNQLQANTSIEALNEAKVPQKEIELQNQFDNKIPKRKSLYNQTKRSESQSMHTFGSKDKNANLLKNLLNLQQKNSSLLVDNCNDYLKNIKIIKIEEKEIFYQQLEEISNLKKKQLFKLKQKYQEEKEKIINQVRFSFEKAKEEFELRVRNRIEEHKKWEKKKQLQEQKENWEVSKRLLSNGSLLWKEKLHELINSSTSSIDSADQIKVATPKKKNKYWNSSDFCAKQQDFQDHENQKKKTSLVSSLKKEGSNNSLIKKVRFKHDSLQKNDGKCQKFRTDEEINSTSFELGDARLNFQISKYD